MRVLFSFFGRRRAHAAGGTLARGLGSAATLVRRRLVAATDLRDTSQLRRNQIEAAIPYHELNGLLAVDVLTGRVQPCALAQQATDAIGAIVERLGEAAL